MYTKFALLQNDIQLEMLETEHLIDLHSVMPTYNYGNDHVSTGCIFNLLPEHREI